MAEKDPFEDLAFFHAQKASWSRRPVDNFSLRTPSLLRLGWRLLQDHGVLALAILSRLVESGSFFVVFKAAKEEPFFQIIG
jgi:hypothetical protein